MQKVVVILHGWGSLMSGEKRFKEVKKMFEEKGYLCFTPDLPGFGQNILKKDALVFEDYVFFVEKYVGKVLKQTRQKKIILIGHSFGGRIAIRYTAQHNSTVEKLILAAPSGIIHPLSLKKRLLAIASNFIKPFFSLPILSSVSELMRKFLYRSIGELDYYKAGELRETFKNVYKISIADDLPHINVPVLLLWGGGDRFVPLKDGEYMQHVIPRAQLTVLPNEKHKFPYESPKQFVDLCLSFLK